MEVGQSAPNHQNMVSSRLPLCRAVRIGPFLEGFVFSLQGLFKSSSPLSPPYTSMYSALKCLLLPRKGNGRREFQLWRGPGTVAEDFEGSFGLMVLGEDLCGRGKHREH